MQKITLIAALNPKGIIGKNNKIPWHIPEDFAFFKEHTLGKPIIMGRKTWESLPRRPLVNRRNIIISHNPNYTAAGAEVFINLQNALIACNREPEIMIIGGAQIYAQALPFATDLLLTEVYIVTNGDTYFPQFSIEEWPEKKRISHVSQNGIHFDFVHRIRLR